MNGSRKKLLLLVPNLQLGGQQRVAVNTAAIMTEDYEVYMAVFDAENAVYEPSCPLIDLNVPAAGGRVRKVYRALKRAAKVRRLKRQKRIDLCMSFGPTANLTNVLSRGRETVVLGIRICSPENTGLMARCQYARSDRIICCSRVISETVSALSPRCAKKACCLYNPYDLEEIRRQGAEPVDDYAFCGKTIVSHGRLSEVKNYPRLIKAFSIVHGELPETRLLIVGEGGERARLERLIADLDLAGSATLLGLRKNPYPYLARSALYVLSSYAEGFPNALVEGMAFLPVIAVDCKSGPREILSQKSLDCVTQGVERADYGILVQPAHDRLFHSEITEDDAILAAAMLELLRDDSLRTDYAAKAKTRAEEFSFAVYHDMLSAYLKEAVSCRER